MVQTKHKSEFQKRLQQLSIHRSGYFSLCCISEVDTSILPTPTMETVFSSSVKKKKKTEHQLSVQLLYLHGTFKNCRRDQTISKLQNLSHDKIPKCKYSVNLSFIIHSYIWSDMESVVSKILSKIFLVDENHTNSFLRNVMLWSTHLHISPLFLQNSYVHLTQDQ